MYPSKWVCRACSCENTDRELCKECDCDREDDAYIWNEKKKEFKKVGRSFF